MDVLNDMCLLSVHIISLVMMSGAHLKMRTSAARFPVLGVFELGNFQLLLHLQHQSMDAVSISRLVTACWLRGKSSGRFGSHRSSSSERS